MRIGTQGLELAQGETFALGRALPGRRVRVIDGTLWLTQSGDGRDHILLPGDVFRVERPGRVVLLALRASTFKLQSSGDQAA